MKPRIGAYVTVLSWYLIALAALSVWVYSVAAHADPVAVVILEGLGALVFVWLGIGVATGCTLAGRWMARTEPTTLSRAFRLGSATAGVGSLVGLASVAALCPIGYGLAYAQHLLR